MRAIAIAGLLVLGLSGCAASDRGEESVADHVNRGEVEPEEMETVQAVIVEQDSGNLPAGTLSDSVPLTPYRARLLGEEHERIAPLAGRVERDRDKLVVKPRRGPAIVFRDVSSGDASEHFSLWSYEEEIDSYLIHVRYWEGDGYVLVNGTSGHQTYLDAPPVVSPDRKRLITVNMDLEAGYTPTRIQIYRIAPDSLELEWTHEPEGDPAWGPSEAEWVDSVTVRALKNVPDYSVGIENTEVPIVLRLIEHGWTIEEEPAGESVGEVPASGDPPRRR